MNNYIANFNKFFLDINTKNVVYSSITNEEKIMNKKQTLNKYSVDLVTNWFKNGEGLRSVDLKNYTSGDNKKNTSGRHIGFEGITEKIIKKGLELYNLTHRSKVNGDYFVDPDGVYDSQRMDNHIWIDGKVVLVEENRAWIDKPFYTLKRAVVKAFMEVPSVRKHLSDDVKFIFTSLAKDVTSATKSTSDVVFEHGDRIVESNFSGHPRRSDKYNYFDNGVDYSELECYVNTLCEIFEKYEK
tara:strand:+ start:102 stop:827 length:726 start_codon:yes stop_codon:yes gene_type:complete